MPPWKGQLSCRVRISAACPPHQAKMSTAPRQRLHLHGRKSWPNRVTRSASVGGRAGSVKSLSGLPVLIDP